MKKELIKKLFDKFDKDKNIIKLNLIQAMDYIILEAHDKEGRLTMTIEYKKNKVD